MLGIREIFINKVRYITQIKNNAVSVVFHHIRSKRTVDKSMFCFIDICCAATFYRVNYQVVSSFAVNSQSLYRMNEITRSLFTCIGISVPWRAIEGYRYICKRLSDEVITYLHGQSVILFYSFRTENDRCGMSCCKSSSGQRYRRKSGLVSLGIQDHVHEIRSGILAIIWKYSHTDKRRIIKIRRLTYRFGKVQGYLLHSILQSDCSRRIGHIRRHCSGNILRHTYNYLLQILSKRISTLGHPEPELMKHPVHSHEHTGMVFRFRNRRKCPMLHRSRDHDVRTA